MHDANQLDGSICKKQRLESPLISLLDDHFKKQLVVFNNFIKRGPSKTAIFHWKPSKWSPMDIVFLSAESKGLYLLRSFKFSDMISRLSKTDSIMPMTPNDIVQFCGGQIETDESVQFNDDSITSLEYRLQMRIYIYELNTFNRIDPSDQVVRGSYAKQYPGTLNLVINSRSLMNTDKAVFYLLANSKPMGMYYTCSSCGFDTTDKWKLSRHSSRENDCAGGVTKITSAQRALGNPESLMEKCIRQGYIPSSFLSYRQKYLVCFDIECLEEKVDPSNQYGNTSQEAKHNLVSLAMASNIPGKEDKFFIRKSSDPECEQQVISEFVKELYRLSTDFITTYVPSEIKMAISNISERLENMKFGHEKVEHEGLNRFLKGYLKLPVYGFNACKLSVLLHN